MAPCPHCGGPVKATIDDVARGLLSINQQTIFNYIWDNPGAEMAHVVNAVYSGVRDGGPQNAPNAVAVTITKINQKVAPLGMRVVGKKGRGGGGYKVEVESMNRLDLAK